MNLTSVKDTNVSGPDVRVRVWEVARRLLVTVVGLANRWGRSSGYRLNHSTVALPFLELFY